MQKNRSTLSSGDDTQPSVLFLENGNHDLVLRFQPSCLEQSDYGNLCNHTSFDHEIEGFVVKIQFVNSTDVIEKFFHRKQVSCENDDGWIQQCDAYLSDMPNNWQRYTVSMATNFTDGKQSSFSSPSPSVVNGAWALPHVIRRLYNITMCKEDAIRANSSGVDSTGGVVLFEHQYYNPDDLVKFMQANYLDATPAAVVNPTDPNDPTQPGDEAQADIELLSANGVGSASSTFWYASDKPDGVLEWILQIANASDETVPKVGR